MGAPVTATGGAGALTYTLGGTDAASFEIVAATGQIRTKEGVVYDHEAKSSYSVTVTATDTLDITQTATVAITVTDEDEPPLVALYNATDGADWTDNTNWLSDGSLDDWYGVTTDAKGRVTTLDLSDNQLSGAIPGELGNLSNLERLYLSFNQLSAIPKELGNLSSLRSLSVSSNQLSGAIPGELGNLSNLERLSLTGNELTGSIPAQLGNLSSLESLDLSDNQLSGAIPARVGQPLQPGKAVPQL